MRAVLVMIFSLCVSGCLGMEGDDFAVHADDLATSQVAPDETVSWIDTDIVAGEAGEDVGTESYTCEDQYGPCKIIPACAQDYPDGQIVKTVCCNAAGCWVDYQYILCGCI